MFIICFYTADIFQTSGSLADILQTTCAIWVIYLIQDDEKSGVSIGYKNPDRIKPCDETE